MQGPENNSYKEFDNEKNSCGSKIPLPPIPFLMVRPLKLDTSEFESKKLKGLLKFDEIKSFV